MFLRISGFLLGQAAGAAAGWWIAQGEGTLHGLAGAMAGLFLGGVGWLAIDLLGAARLVGWLRRGDDSVRPPRAGLWGELAERMRRALRSRDQLVQEGEQRLQDFLAAIQASPNGVVLLDPQWRIEWSNLTAAHHLGIDPQRDVLQVIGNLLRDPAFAAYAAKGDYSSDVVIVGRDSSPGRPVRILVQLHPYGKGRKLLLSRDVTAVEQADTMRRDFVANVSHEIRTPLTVLAGFIETLQNLPLEESERARYLGLMAQQATRMQSLVSDLLTLSRLEGSPLPGADWTPAATLVEQCEHEAQPISSVLGKSSHDLRFEVRDPSEVSGAPSELLSAMSNLVGNAIRYTPPGGSVQVLWRELPDGRGEFSVRDSGPGIAAEHIPRLTERFYRVDRSRSRETGGTGLGLAIVKHVVQRHGAELRVESAPGAGSTFAIVLPASRVRRLRPPAPAASERPATAAP